MIVSSDSLNLPNEPHFRALVQSHRDSPSRVRVCDPGFGIDADLDQLLRDVYATRQSLVASLPAAIFAPHSTIISDDEVVYLPVLAPGNYEFIVASVAILAIGAAIVPLCEFPNHIHGYLHISLIYEDYADTNGCLLSIE